MVNVRSETPTSTEPDSNTGLTNTSIDVSDHQSMVHAESRRGFTEKLYDEAQRTYPYVTYLAHFKDRSVKVGEAVKEDIVESDHPLRTVGVLGGVALTQGFDRLRLVVALLPPVVVHVMEETNNSNTAGLVGGGLFALYGLGLAEALRTGLGKVPTAMEVTKKEFPGLVAVAEDALPGMRNGQTTLQNAPEDAGTIKKAAVHTKNTARRISSSVGTHFRRGLAGIGIGTTAFVATAAVDGQSKREIRKTYAKVAADSGILVAGIAKGTTQGIKHLALNGHPELASDLQGFVENKWTWYTLAAGSMAVEYALNHFQRGSDSGSIEQNDDNVEYAQSEVK